MNEVLTASIFGVLTLIFWGSSTWLFSHTSKKTASSLELNIAIQLPSAIIGFFILFSIDSMPSTKNVLALFLVSLLYTVGFVSFLKAASKGATGVVVPLANTYPLILLMLSIIFLQQSFSLGQVAIIFVLVAGVMLTAFEGDKKTFQIKRLDRHIEYALASALFFGIANFVLNAIVDELSWQAMYSYINIFMLINAVFLVWYMQKKSFIPGFRRSIANKKGLISGLITTVGSLSFYYGIDAVDSVVIIIAIASAEPLIASLLGRIIDKEILTPYKRAGAVMIVSAIILLNIYS